METLERQIRRVHRRLMLQSLAGKLAWCWFVALLIASVAIAVGKFLSLDQRLWAGGWLGGTLAAGAVGAVNWTWARRQSALEAAVEIDRRFGLKERVSSTLSLARDQLQTEIGQALVHDAQQRVGRIDVAERFGLRLDRRALLPLAPAALAIALALFVDVYAPEQPVLAATAETAQVKKSAQAFVKKLDQQRAEAAEKGLTEADGLLKQMEEAMKGLAEKTQADRKQTLVSLNDLVKDAEKRRSQLAGGAELKQQLNQLKNLQQGPAAKLGQALKNGDLAKAIKEIDEIKEQIAANKLEPQAKEALTKQLDQLQQALENKVEAHKQAQEEMKEQIAAQRKAGDTAAADKLQQQLDKLADKASQMDKMSKMAQQLKQASQSMKAGDSKQAADALAQLSDQMAGMQKEMDEMQMLDSALEEMADCKSAMACKECEGEGCAACQGQGQKLSDKWSRVDMAKGGGTGAGARPESKNDTDFYDSQVKQNVTKGGAVIKGVADGPNRKGRVEEEIKGQFSNAQQQTAEALSDQRLPHDYRDHAKKYFDALREGQR
jgi:hypothetical protein